MSMGGGSSVPANTTSTTEVQLPDWAQSAAQTNLQTAQTLAQQPYTAYTGPEVAGFTPDETAAFQGVENLQGGTQPIFNQAIGNVQNLGQTTQSLLNPYLGSVEQDTVSNIERQGQQTLQQQDANAVAAGAYGGTRQAVTDSLINSETQRNVGQAVDQIQQQGWDTASQLALQQSSQLANLASANQSSSLQQLGALASVGQAQQQQTQAEYSNALQNWQTAQNWPYQQLAIAQGSLAGTPYGSTVTGSQPYNSNSLAQDLGLGAASIPALSTLYNWLAPSATGTLGTTALSAATPVATAAAESAPLDAGLITGAGLTSAGTAAAADTAATYGAGTAAAAGLTSAASGAGKGGLGAIGGAAALA